MSQNDVLCRITRGWFCRHVFWPAQHVVERAHHASLIAKIAAIDAEVHPERYLVPNTARWEHDHMRHGH